MSVLQRLSRYFRGGAADDVYIVPPGGGSPGGIDASDLKEIDEFVSTHMREPGEIDFSAYAKEFQSRGPERSDYQRLSMEILLEQGKDFDFAAEYSIWFEEKLNEKIEYLNSDGYDDWRIHQYSFVEMPEEDLRTEPNEEKTYEFELN